MEFAAIGQTREKYIETMMSKKIIYWGDVFDLKLISIMYK